MTAADACTCVIVSHPSLTMEIARSFVGDSAVVSIQNNINTAAVRPPREACAPRASTDTALSCVVGMNSIHVGCAIKVH